MQFGGHKRRDRRAMTNPDTGNIAAKNGFIPMINMMMTCVTGRSDSSNFDAANPRNISIVENPNVLFGHRCDFAPEFLHFVTEYARRRFDQFGGFDQVRRTPWMTIESCAGL